MTHQEIIAAINKVEEDHFRDTCERSKMWDGRISELRSECGKIGHVMAADRLRIDLTTGLRCCVCGSRDR